MSTSISTNYTFTHVRADMAILILLLLLALSPTLQPHVLATIKEDISVAEYSHGSKPGLSEFLNRANHYGYKTFTLTIKSFQLRIIILAKA